LVKTPPGLKRIKGFPFQGMGLGFYLRIGLRPPPGNHYLPVGRAFTPLKIPLV